MSFISKASFIEKRYKHADEDFKLKKLKKLVEKN